MADNDNTTQGPYAYSLTALTGRRRGDDARTVILSFEVRLKLVWLVLLGVLASVPFTAVATELVGVYALFLPAVFAGAAWALGDVRQRRGLKLLNYRAILDSRQASNGILWAAGSPVRHSALVLHIPVVVPAPDRTPVAVPPPTPRGHAVDDTPAEDWEATL